VRVSPILVRWSYPDPEGHTIDCRSDACCAGIFGRSESRPAGSAGGEGFGGPEIGFQKMEANRLEERLQALASGEDPGAV